MNNSLLLMMGLDGVNEAIDNLVIPYLSAIEYDEYFKWTRLQRFYILALAEGWSDLNWEKAHKLGWFCRKDYEIFEELHGYKI